MSGPTRSPHPGRLKVPVTVAILAAVVLVSHWRAGIPGAAAGGNSREAISRVLSPGEVAGTTLLGGFRTIAIDIIWIRIFEGLLEQRFEELGGFYGALEILQGDAPLLYYHLSNQMAFDIPRLLRHRPEERWDWIEQGLQVLERGLQRFPGNLFLLRQAEHAYYFRFDPLRFPEDRRRFLARPERPGDLVPFGRDPIQIARAMGEKALAIPGHSFDVDFILWEIYRLSYGLRLDEAGREKTRPPAAEPAAGDAGDDLRRARALLDHARRDHLGVEGLEEILGAWSRQLQEESRKGGSPPPGGAVGSPEPRG